MNQFGRAAAGTKCKIPFLDQGGLEAACSSVKGDAGSRNSSTNHEHIIMRMTQFITKVFP